MILTIPPRVHADGLLPFLAHLSSVGDAAEIHLDFTELRRVSPGALVALVATVTRWLRQHRTVVFLNLDRCVITGYLQRMDVLNRCGAELPENFTRHDSRGRFVPVRLVEKIGNELAGCLAPGGEDYEHPNASLYDLAWYVFTETANNARQHSGGLGYAAAQVARSEGLLRLARLARGWLLVVSGSGVVRLNASGNAEILPFPEAGHFEGTLLVTAFRQKSITDFAELLHEAKLQSGLLRVEAPDGRFKS